MPYNKITNGFEIKDFRGVQVTELARRIGVRVDEIYPYGNYIAKVSSSVLERIKHRPDAKLILVTGLTPTKLGEGKTTISIGMSEALGLMKKKAVLCLREPSVGLLFSRKGGGCGGGKARVIPNIDIGLQFTGDFYSVSLAHNLVSSVIDNHLYWGNELRIDPQEICWPRTTELCDRALKKVKIGCAAPKGHERSEDFQMTGASEIMTILAVSETIEELKNRLSNIIVAYTADKKPVRVCDFKGLADTLTVILHKALHPNLVQTQEGQPVFVHTGTFANLSIGSPSIISIKLAMKLADYVVVEAGFGSDLGAEIFFDIVCKKASRNPAAVLIVVSTRALKVHGGKPLAQADKEDIKALAQGFENLERHIAILKTFGVSVVVAINKFQFDVEQELNIIREHCALIGVKAFVADVFSKGGHGAEELCREVLSIAQREKSIPCNFTYAHTLSPEEKIAALAKKIYAAEEVIYSNKARADLEHIKKLGCGTLPVCIAKTQFSLTQDPRVLGKPTPWNMVIGGVKLYAGAGIIIPVLGELSFLPGMPKTPAVSKIKLEDDLSVSGPF